MTVDQSLAFAILFAALGLFALTRLRHDMVALIVLLATVLAGLVKPEDAFTGFSNSAVITVAAVLVLSYGLRRAGVVDAIAARIIPMTQGRHAHIAVLTATCAAASAFMNNVGALALLMPVAIATAAARDRSPAMLLMPLAFASLLGGMTTLIGTPPNLIVASFRAQTDAGAFGMFDFGPVGLVVAAAGLVFLVLAGWRLIPKERLSLSGAKSLFEVSDYLVELAVPEGSPVIGRSLRFVTGVGEEAVNIVGVVRGEETLSPFPFVTMEAGDVILAHLDPTDADEFAKTHKLDILAGTRRESLKSLATDEHVLAEAIVSPGSDLVGRDLRYLRYRAGDRLAVVAVARSGNPIRTRLGRVRFQAGDILLVQGTEKELGEAYATLALMPLAAREIALGGTTRTLVALAIFGCAIAAAALRLLPAPIAFTAAAVGFVIARVIPVKDFYTGIDWSVVVLLGAMFPLGLALESSGATALLAGLVVAAAEGTSPILVLALVLIVTMLVSDIVNNAATALIMAPFSIEIANGLSVSADPFLMAVAVGASCAFLTPIGHQSNTLVLGPGGYKFGDYWRVGLPLEIVIVAVGLPAILVFWPL